MSWEVRTMRSGTSFFNGTLYRKAFFRFWPIWAIYGAQLLLLIPLPFLATALRRDGYRLSDLVYIPDSLVFGAASALVAGVVCAMAVFSCLYSSRSACMMHALPVRREALFCSNYLAGLSFLLGVNSILMGLLAEVLSRTYFEAQDKKSYRIKNIVRSGTQGKDREATDSAGR